MFYNLFEQTSVDGEYELCADMALLKDMNAKFNQIIATSDAHGAALDTLRCMFWDFLGKSKQMEDRSLSITQSVLEQHESVGLERTATSKGGANTCDTSVTDTTANVTLAPLEFETGAGLLVLDTPQVQAQRRMQPCLRRNPSGVTALHHSVHTNARRTNQPYGTCSG